MLVGTHDHFQGMKACLLLLQQMRFYLCPQTLQQGVLYQTLKWVLRDFWDQTVVFSHKPSHVY